MPPSSESSSSSTSSSRTFEITILKASGLAGKDRSMFSFSKTSDPFINIMVNDRIMHRTSIKDKTLDPVWNESFTVNLDDCYEFKKNNGSGDKKKIWLQVLDHDMLTENDPMGSVTLFETNDNDDLGTMKETTEWYEIPPESASNACGKIQVRVAGVSVDEM